MMRAGARSFTQNQRSVPARSVGLGALFAMLVLGVSSSAFAFVDFQIEYADAEGTGFFDPMPRAPSGGNPGTTLGEQRRLAFEHALSIWSRALDSSVPVRIEAVFAPFPDLFCATSSAVLGGARAVSAFSGFEGAPRPELLYPGALADKLAGVDLDPSEPDIVALFNPHVDDAECLGDIGWNYGLEAGSSQAEFVHTVLHEIAHGLGFSSVVDEPTGEAPLGISAYETQMFDHGFGTTWDRLSPAERRESAENPFGLSWLGPRVTAAAGDLLESGKPVLRIAEQDDVLLVAETMFGPRVTERAASGELIQLSAAEACNGAQDLSGRVALLEGTDECAGWAEQIVRVQRRGAVGALLRSEVPGLPPFGVSGRDDRVTIPSLSISQTDFGRLTQALDEQGALRVSLESLPGLIGTDDDGRVLLGASRPLLVGSSISHWDRSVRRRTTASSDADSLLMEPVVDGVLKNEVTDLTVQLLQDIGWGTVACGNGLREAGEECDDGERNSNQLPDACRLTCVAPRCGDGVVDSVEACELDQAGCSASCRFLRDAGTPRQDSGAPRDAGTLRDSGALRDAGVQASASADTGIDGGSASVTPTEAGCGCRLNSRSSTGVWGVWGALGACVLRYRRGRAERRGGRALTSFCRSSFRSASRAVPWGRWRCGRCGASFRRTAR